MPKKYEGWQNIQTLQFKQIISNLEDAKEYQLARLLISQTGLGKTHAIQIFQRKHGDTIHVITVGDSFKLVHLVDELMNSLGLKYPSRKLMINEKLKMISDKFRQLRSAGIKPVIIFDEAENLKPSVLKTIKELYDAIHKHCAIVLIGTDQILDSILNRRNKNRQSVPQLWRRFKAGMRNISPLNKARDFAPFFKQYDVDPAIQDLLLEHAENYGELHDFLEPVLRYAAKRNQEVTEKLFCHIHGLQGKMKAV